MPQRPLEPLYSTRVFTPDPVDAAGDVAAKVHVIGVIGLVVASVGGWQWVAAPSGTGLSIVFGQLLCICGAAVAAGSFALPWMLRKAGTAIPNIPRVVEFFGDAVRIKYTEGGVNAFSFDDVALFSWTSSEMRILFVDGAEIVVPATAFKDREYFEFACALVDGYKKEREFQSLRAA